MIYKRSFGTRVFIIAKEYGVEQTVVSKIINSYISVCRDSLLRGTELRILGLVNVVPDYKSSDYIPTTAYFCKLVSTKLGTPYYTTYGIVSCYLESLKIDLFNGNPVDIRGIVSLHPLERDGNLCKIRSLISVSIKSDLEKLNGCVTSARAHTCKLLKYNLANNIGDM